MLGVQKGIDDFRMAYFHIKTQQYIPQHVKFLKITEVNGHVVIVFSQTSKGQIDTNGLASHDNPYDSCLHLETFAFSVRVQ